MIFTFCTKSVRFLVEATRSARQLVPSKSQMCDPDLWWAHMRPEEREALVAELKSTGTIREPRCSFVDRGKLVPSLWLCRDMGVYLLANCGHSEDVYDADGHVAHSYETDMKRIGYEKQKALMASLGLVGKSVDVLPITLFSEHLLEDKLYIELAGDRITILTHRP